jgi:hypothetical protein
LPPVTIWSGALGVGDGDGDASGLGLAAGPIVGEAVVCTVTAGDIVAVGVGLDADAPVQPTKKTKAVGTPTSALVAFMCRP